MDVFWLSMATAAPTGTAFVGEEERALVLVRTEVAAEVLQDVAVVDVHQTFQNPFREPLDATYQFPLPVGATLRSFVVTCEDREIQGPIQTRTAAIEAYGEALERGEPAAAVDPESTNLFSQEVVGLCAKQPIQVDLQYVEDLQVREGIHTFAVPTTVGFRHDPDAALASGRAREATAVELVVHSGRPLVLVESDGSAEVLEQLAEGARIGLTQPPESAADVVIQWRVPSDSPQVSAVTAKEADGTAYVGLTLHPPVPDAAPESRLREVVLVLDTSCSMWRGPWERAVAAVDALLDGLREGETFDLIHFTGETDVAFPEPVGSTEDSREAARQWLAAVGAEVRDRSYWLREYEPSFGVHRGLLGALRLPGDEEALRTVVLLTDGYMVVEPSDLRTVAEQRAVNTRIFALGIGSLVDHALIEGLVHHGRGDALFQRIDAPIAETIDALRQRIDRPIVTDLRIDWGSLDVELTEPIPDLFLGQPVHVIGRVGAGTRSEVVLHGLLAGEPWSTTVDIDLASASADEVLPVVWARRRVASWKLALDAVHEPQAAVDLALRYSLLDSQDSRVAASPDIACAGPAGRTVVRRPAWRYRDELSPGRLWVEKGARMTGVQVGATLPTYYTAGSSPGFLGMSVGGESGYNATPARGSFVFATVVGPLSSCAIQEAIQPHTTRLRTCYLRARTETPTLAGKLLVRFVIRSDGRVRAVELTEDTLHDAAVAQCAIPIDGQEP